MDGKGGGQTSLSQTTNQKRKREEEVSKYGAEIQWRKYPRLLLHFLNSIPSGVHRRPWLDVPWPWLFVLAVAICAWPWLFVLFRKKTLKN
jgi:hypothetical protein